MNFLGQIFCLFYSLMIAFMVSRIDRIILRRPILEIPLYINHFRMFSILSSAGIIILSLTLAVK